MRKMFSGYKTRNSQYSNTSVSSLADATDTSDSGKRQLELLAYLLVPRNPLPRT